MNNLHKRAELLANVAIVVVAILLGVVLVKRFVLNSNTNAPAINHLAAAERVPLEGIDWSKNRHTLLLVLQKGCRYCTESAPFYQRLIKETSNRTNIKLVALLPDSITESKQYLDEIGVNISDIRQVPPRDIRVGGTPTLILVNESGVVLDVWKGKLAPEKEAEMISKLKG